MVTLESQNKPLQVFHKQVSTVFSKNIYMNPDETVTTGKWMREEKGGREKGAEKERRWEKDFSSMMKQTQEIHFSTSFS